MTWLRKVHMGARRWLVLLAALVVVGSGAMGLAAGPFYDSVAGFIGTADTDLDLAGNKAYDSTGPLQLGAACTSSHALGTAATCIGGGFEANGLSYLDATTQVANNIQFQFGASAATNMTWNTAQTPDTLVWQSNTPEMKVRNGDAGTDFAFADPGYPVTAWQSSDQTNVNKRIWIGHDGTDGLLSSGVGHVSITPAAGKAARITTGLLALDETTAPTPIAGVAQLFATTADLLRMTTDGGTFTIGGAVPGFQNYTHPTTTSGTQYLAGFYDMPAADANLTQASTTVTHGTATNGYGAHAGLVAGGAGTVDAGTVSIVVSGTSFDPATGTRTTSDSEVLVADITTLTLNQKVETIKVWLGTVTYTLTPAGAAVYSVDFNYGWMSYADFGDRDFTITDVAANYHGAANETNLDIIVYHHDVNNWVYHSTAFVPGGTVIVSRSTDYATDAAVSNGEIGKYKRIGLSTLVDGADSEGYVIRLDTDVNNSIHHINIAIGANF